MWVTRHDYYAVLHTTHYTIDNAQCYGAQPPTRDTDLCCKWQKAVREEALETGCTFSAGINFPDVDARKRFLSRLYKARNAASSDGCLKVDNYSLLSMLLDQFEEARGTGDAAPVTATNDTATAGTTPENRSMLKHSGNLLNFPVHLNLSHYFI